MAKIFDWDGRNNTLIESVSGQKATNTNTKFVATSKGNACLFNNNKFTYTNATAAYTVFTVVIWAKFTTSGTVMATTGGTNDGEYMISYAAASIYTNNQTSNTFKAWTNDQRWHMFVLQRNNTSCTFYVDNVSLGTSTLGDNTAQSLKQIGRRTNEDVPMYGNINRVIMYDTIISANDLTNLYTQFLTSGIRKSETNRRKSNISINPDEVGMMCAFKFVDNPTPLVCIKTGATMTNVNNPIRTNDSIKYIEANSQKGTIGNIGTVKTIRMQIKLGSTIEKILEGRTNAALIYANAGILTYPEFTNAYVNGIDSDTIVANQWMDVVITSSGGVSMSATTLALNNATYGDVEFREIEFYSDVKSTSWIITKNNQFASRILWNENFNCGADAIVKNIPGWITTSGTWKVGELSTTDSILKHLKTATPYKENVTVGSIYRQCTIAVGTFTCFFYKPDTANLEIHFVNTNKVGSTTNTGYYIKIDSSEAISVLEDNTEKFKTANSYIAANTWYELKVTNTTAGVRTTYIRGGSYGMVWTEMVESSGSNPFTDTTYMTSNCVLVKTDIVGTRTTMYNWIEGILQ